MTKVDIFSGFLGAGKTTLIKKLIAEAYEGEKIVLIENEFGEIGIDGGFLKDAGIIINEMNSGCICCSLVGDFAEALKKVMDEFSPDRILIEPSGVGKLSDIIEAVENLQLDEVKLNGFTTVVDAKKVKVYMKNFGEFYNNQVEHASSIIFSHTKGMDEERLAQAVELIRDHNDHAVVITTDWDVLDGKQILEAMERKDTIEAALSLMEEEHHHHHDHDGHCCCGHDHDHDHHDHDDHHCGSCGDCHECGDCADHDHECDHDCHEHHHDHECSHGHHDHEHHEHEHHHDGGCGCGHDHGHGHEGHHHADEVFDSIGIETTKKFSLEDVVMAMAELDDEYSYGTVLRAKGIVENEKGEWIHFDYIPGEPDFRKGAAGVTGRICIIGTDLYEEGIRRLFGV